MTEDPTSASDGSVTPAAGGEWFDAPADEGRLESLGVSLLVVLAGFAGYVVWALVFYSIAAAVTGSPLTELQASLLDPPAVGLGFGTGVLAYLAYSRYDLDFLDVSVPGLRALAYLVAGTAALVALNYGAEFLYGVLSIPSPSHSTVETIQTGGPDVALYFVVAALVFIGPAEELLFRNVIQKRLTPSYGWIGAVLVSSAVFALAHTFAYYDQPVRLAAALVVVFVLSAVLGVVYERTRSLPVVALIHGGYDAILFGMVGLGYAFV